ncbi:MAG: DUF4271 domain-containing protein [Chitinophagaceae bacterium]|nr:DUF4271 domain-containing protein [Chitinophagaceae bacterium]
MIVGQIENETINQKFVDSLVVMALATEKKPTRQYITPKRIVHNDTSDFYFLLLLLGVWGLFKTNNPKFFNDVWRAFINPTLGSRQIKELIQSAAIANLLMNLLSTIVIGIYFYYLITINVDWRFASIPSGLAIGLITVGTVLVYAGKYLFVQFAGWTFNKDQAAEQYNFNVFLTNKIIGITLLPFLVGFAFLDLKFRFTLVVISAVILILLFVNRYFRSWSILAQIFQNSVFHFFMYLCAFEILPMVVILKIVMLLL